MALPEPDRVSSSLKCIPQNDGSAGLVTTRQRRFVGQYEAPIDFRVVMAPVINAQRGHADLGGFRLCPQRSTLETSFLPEQNMPLEDQAFANVRAMQSQQP